MRKQIKKLKLSSFTRPDWLIHRIFFLALLIRLITIFQASLTPISYGLIQDTQEFDTLATEITKGHFYHPHLAYINLFYPHFLSFIYSLFGHARFIVFLIQAILDAINCYLIFFIASYLFNKKIGVISATMYAFYGIIIFYNGTLLATTMVLFLTLLAFFLLCLAKIKDRWWTYCLSGVGFGLVYSARQNIGLFLLLLPIWILLDHNKNLFKKRLLNMTMLCSGILFIVSIMLFRNYSIEGKISPFSSHGGINFYIGNNPEATGQFMSPDGVSHSPLKQVSTSILIAEKESGRKLTPQQASRFWYLKSFNFIKNNPVKASLLTIKKGILFWRKEEIPLNENYRFCKTLVPILHFPFISFGLIAPFGLLGIFISLKNRKCRLIILFILLYMISITMFFVSARYRLPIIPFLLIFCSYGLTQIIKWIRNKNKRKLIQFIPLLGLLFIGINLKMKPFESVIDPAVDHNNLGSVYLNQGQLEKAENEFRKVLQLQPNHVQGHFNLGLVYHHKALYQEAVKEYNLAIAQDPQFYPAYHNLGMVYHKLGQNLDAEKTLEKALNLDPESDKTTFGLGELYFNQARYREAQKMFGKTIEMNPTFIEAYYFLGMIYLKESQKEKASEIWEKALTIDPNHTKIIDQRKKLLESHSHSLDSLQN